MVLEKALESPVDCKDIQPVNSKGNQPWILIGSTDAEAPVLWPPDAKNWLIGKRLWFWERLKAGREGDDRGWDGWMAAPTWWTWAWASSGSWEVHGVKKSQTRLSNWTEHGQCTWAILSSKITGKGKLFSNSWPKMGVYPFHEQRYAL